MGSTCVVGLQWGDEAKGKVVDLLTGQHEIVVRYNGGANAGHTVVVGKEVYKLSLIPRESPGPGCSASSATAPSSTRKSYSPKSMNLSHAA